MILCPYWSNIEQLYCVRELVQEWISITVGSIEICSISWCKPSSGVKVMVAGRGSWCEEIG